MPRRARAAPSAHAPPPAPNAGSDGPIWGSSADPRVSLWFNNDFTGTGTGSLTWALIVAGCGFFWSAVVLPWSASSYSREPYVHAAIVTVLLAMAAWSHVVAALSDPLAAGIRLSSAHASATCHRCDAPKPDRAHHCRVCDRCIIGMDHHCPWVNNCVGDGNRKAFMLFLIYTGAGSFYGCLMAIRWYFFVHVCPTSQLYMLECLGASGMTKMLCMWAMGFGFTAFTMAMLVSQVTGVLTNTGQIDRMKRIRRAHGPALTEFKKYFGDSIGPGWLSPGWIKRPATYDAGLAARNVNASTGMPADGMPGVHNPRSACLGQLVISVIASGAALRIIFLVVSLILQLSSMYWPKVHFSIELGGGESAAGSAAASTLA